MAWIDTNGLYHGTWDYTKHGCAIRDWNSTQGRAGRRDAGGRLPALPRRRPAARVFRERLDQPAGPGVQPHPPRAAGQGRPGLRPGPVPRPQGRSASGSGSTCCGTATPTPCSRRRRSPSSRSCRSTRAARRSSASPRPPTRTTRPCWRSSATAASRRWPTRASTCRGRKSSPAPAGSSFRRRCRSRARRWPPRRMPKASCTWRGSVRRGRSAWRPNCTAPATAGLHAGREHAAGADAAVQYADRQAPLGQQHYALVLARDVSAASRRMSA